jgi:alpha-glucosidase
MYLDIDYMPGGWALTFDGSSFPDPGGMIASLHGDGFHVVANISPFLMHDDPKYGTANSAGYLIKENDGTNQDGWHDYWIYVGGAGTGWLSWIDFSKTAACTWWTGQHTSFLGYGIDGIWNDLNEPDEFGTWADNVKYDFDGNPTDHCETSTQYCLLQTGFSYQTLEDHYANTRPFVVSRGAYAGIQRYSAVWSGDNTGNWSHLAMNIPMGLSMSISGQPHNGHDIGGFFGSPDIKDKPTGELFARWMQWGVFSGFCRAHHDGFGNRESGWPYVEPWEFGTTVENICRDYIGLRYQLMPYLYSLYHEAHTTGAAIQRPTFYDFPDDAATLDQDYDFMFGPFILVAPVVSEAATTKSAYLPSGSDWIDYWTDALHTGGQTVVVSAPLDVLPIFVREGAIIPMGPVMEYADELTPDEITFETWPSASSSSFDLYEDDGISFDYETGEYAEVTLAQQLVSGMLEFDISGRSGSYVPASRHFLVKVHRWSDPVTNVKLDEVPLDQYSNLTELRTAGTGYYYNATGDIVYARFPDTGLAQNMVINEVATVPYWEVY